MGYFLVTGGCGFIGSNLVKSLLADGHSVRILDDLSTGSMFSLPKKVDLIVGSVTDIATVADAIQGVDGCYHLAAISSIERSTLDRIGTHTVNLTGTVNILQQAHLAANNPIPVVYASSAAVYGNEGRIPGSEDVSPTPISAYGADKLGCELHARVASKLHNVPTFGLRLFNVYGPNQNSTFSSSGVISIFLRNMLHGNPITIYGDGNQIRDFIYVDDAIKFLRRAMEYADTRAIVTNACTGYGRTIRELVEVLSTTTNIKPICHWRAPKQDEILSSVGVPKFASEILGLVANTEFVDGIKLTLDWHKHHMN